VILMGNPTWHLFDWDLTLHVLGFRSSRYVPFVEIKNSILLL